MAYDEELAARIRATLGLEPDLAEKPMFGGLAFLIGGRMAVAARGGGGLLVRVDPARSDELTQLAGVERMVMRGRPMDGWLDVGTDQVTDDSALRSWVERGVAYARAQGPKP